MSTPKLSDWERIEYVRKLYKFKSVNQFALHIGLHRAETLFQIKRGSYGISKKLAATIHTAFPEIQEGWLITGESDAPAEIVRDSSPERNFNTFVIPRYTGYPKKTERPEYLISSHGPVNVADLAVTLVRDVRPYRLLPGTVLYLKEENLLHAGKLYYIITQTNVCLLGKITKSSIHKEVLEIYGDNSPKPGKRKIRRDAIDGYYRVVGYTMSFNQ